MCIFFVILALNHVALLPTQSRRNLFLKITNKVQHAHNLTTTSKTTFLKGRSD